MKRRDFLVTTAAVTTGIATSGTSQGSVGAGVGDQLPYASEFETVVDAVEVGADPSGGAPVNFLFEEYAGEETLLAFEPGTYEIDYFEIGDMEHLGVVGTGSNRAQFVPAEGQCRGGHPWVAFRNVRDLLLENVTFDFRRTGAGGPLHFLLEGDSTIRDVSCLGSCSNQISLVKIDVRDKNGSARVENFVARNSDDNQSLTGVYVNENHAGELTFANCQMENFSDNGLYASSPGDFDGQDGTVNVIGGTYRNNNVSGVRLGTTGARAEDVTVVVDTEVPGWGTLNARGIRLRNKSGQVIDNCEITFGTNAAESFGGIVFHPENGGASVTETTVTVDRGGVPAVRAFPVATPAQTPPVFENCVFTGDAADGVAARIEGRDGTVFRGCTVDGTGTNRRGIDVLDSENCRIVDSRIDVNSAPVVVENGTVEIENTIVVTGDGDRYIRQRTLENEVLAASPKAGEVNVVNTSLSDQPVDGTPSSHTLEFTAENVSADNSTDSFSIELPEAIDVGDDDVENVTVMNGDYNVTPSVENNTINFEVNPDTDDTSLVDLDIEVDMTLSADDSS